MAGDRRFPIKKFTPQTKEPQVDQLVKIQLEPQLPPLRKGLSLWLKTAIAASIVGICLLEGLILIRNELSTGSPRVFTTTSAPITPTKPPSPELTNTSITITPTKSLPKRKIAAASAKNPLNAINIDWPNLDYWHSQIPEKTIALTFDDGPYPNATEKVLDLLKKHNIKATFFLLGQQVEQNCEMVQRMVDEGHELANHSYNHPVMTKYNINFQKQQIEKTQRAIEKCVGREYLPRWFRSPYGAQNTTTIKLANMARMNTAVWTIDTYDWRRRITTQSITNKIMKSSGNDIILMHDSTYKKTLPALEKIITKFKASNMEFVTMSEVFQSIQKRKSYTYKQ